MPAISFIKPNELKVDKNFTACVSGHRRAYDMVEEELVKTEFTKLIERGYNAFLVGMAVGFDLYCCKILESLKKRYNFRVIACIPCKNQDAFFNEKQKEEYKKYVELADERVLIQEEYTAYCMHKRNRFMVDNSSAIVCYLRKNAGGTKYTVDYALDKNLEIIKV